MPKKKCELCQKPFVPTTSWQKFCSPQHSQKHRNNKRAHEIQEKVCANEGCENTFKARHARYSYCSPGCRRENKLAKESLGRLLDPNSGAGSPTAPRKPRQAHPDGWTPGVEINGKTGTITTKPLETKDPQWSEQLKTWGFDPDQYRIVEPVQIRTWEAAIGNGEVRQLWYYRASIASRYGDHEARVDVEKLSKQIARLKPTKLPPASPGAFCVFLADWQAGKRDGDGLEGLIERVHQTISEARARVDELRKVGRELGTLYVFGLGDLQEGCDGFYAQQTFTVELDGRDQRKIVRRLLLRAIQEWAGMFSKVVVAGVGGNHGENRKDGKSYTTFGDNADVEIMESVADILAANPERYGHVRFTLPKEELSLTLDVCGTIVGIAHGHQAKGPGKGAEKVWRWWMDQAAGRQPVGDADILVTGHYHYFAVREEGVRAHFQAPTLDGGSDWWREAKGTDTRAGTLTMVVGDGGWSDVAILGR